MPGAATAVATLPELLRCVAEQILTTRQLATLCLVNKTFNAAITPLLYRDLEVNDGTLPLLKVWLEAGRLTHVRALTVSLDKTLSHQETMDTFLPLLGQMGRLERLTQVTAHIVERWLDKGRASQFEGEGGPGPNGGTRLPVSLLDAFRERCSGLKHLDITFCENMGGFLGHSDEALPEGTGEEERRLYGRPDLASFSGLRSLALRNLYQELDWWRDQIVTALRQSPDLQHLELSLGLWTVHLYQAENELAKFEHWFDELCNAYTATGAKPLRLRSLRLGFATFPRRSESAEKLADLSCLEDLHITNEGTYFKGQIVIDMYNHEDEDSGIAFDAFGPDRCPSLRRFSMAVYHRDVHDMLAQADPAWLRNLALSCEGLWGGWELPGLLRPDPDGLYPQLPMHPRMLHMELDRSKVSLVNYEGEHLPSEDIPAAKQVLDDLAAGDDGALEGLGVHLKVRRGAGEGPADPGEHCFEDLDLLADAVGKLPNLTQLAIVDCKTTYAKERILEEREAEDAARLLAMANPRLRYIQVHRRYWRAWREDGNVRLEKLAQLDDAAMEVDVKKLGEASQVELFRFLNWQPQPL
ncbi:hypothetical protein VTJ83DRAFT_1409 [Remersonia thermophila]|uniref:F-box domain-containing protein n=1 Tax=Remersonia thermophila TaxID=72144 RepID=A0ABR4DNY5_9PEZI